MGPHGPTFSLWHMIILLVIVILMFSATNLFGGPPDGPGDLKRTVDRSAARARWQRR
jgi:hypothetical protein